MTWVYPVLGMMEEVPSAIKDAQARWSIAGFKLRKDDEKAFKKSGFSSLQRFFNISLKRFRFACNFT